MCAERTRGLVPCSISILTSVRSRASCLPVGFGEAGSRGLSVRGGRSNLRACHTIQSALRGLRRCAGHIAEAVRPWRREGLCAVLAFAAVHVRIRIDCVYLLACNCRTSAVRTRELGKCLGAIRLVEDRERGCGHRRESLCEIRIHEVMKGELIALGMYVSTYSANSPHAVKRHTYVKTSMELQ